MPIEATVFFRLECSLGSVRFVGLSAAETAELPCPSTPQITRLTVEPGEYRLAFRDSNDDRRWEQWLFSAARGGGAYYWGDISILPGLARVEPRTSTLQKIRRESNLNVETGVTEKR